MRYSLEKGEAIAIVSQNVGQVRFLFLRSPFRHLRSNGGSLSTPPCTTLLTLPSFLTRDRILQCLLCTQRSGARVGDLQTVLPKYQPNALLRRERDVSQQWVVPSQMGYFIAYRWLYGPDLEQCSLFPTLRTIATRDPQYTVSVLH